MAKREDVIYAHDRPEHLLWARYIDNILLLWSGSQSSFLSFMEELNNNQKRYNGLLQLAKALFFLVLEIEVVDHRLVIPILKDH